MIDSFVQKAQDAVRRGDMAQAEAALRQMLAIEPTNAWALGLLGGVLAEGGRVEEAVAALEAASAHRPNDPDLLSNRAALLYRLQREAEGIPMARKAIGLRPDDPRAHMILAEALLRRGEFEEGWREYEWRMRMPNYASHGRGELPQPRWNGGDIAGKTILVHAEQGLGDMLWMIRYVPLLAARGARVIVECEAPLRSLLSRVQGASVVIARGEVVPAFDLHCPVMSLPLAFGTAATNVPYLSANPARAVSGLPPFDGTRIGIAWAGGPRARQRRCPARLFDDLIDAAGDVRWVSLQVAGPHVEPLQHPSIADLTPSLRDFDDTAALIAQLDLVISIDTVVTHLAGAMGMPVWTLLSHAADWRWLRDRADSPWYPTMRLFRQPARGDWDSVRRDVAHALRQLP